MTCDLLALSMDFAVNDNFKLSAERMAFHHGVTFSETKMKYLFERGCASLADLDKPNSVVPLPFTKFNFHKPVLIENDGSMLRHTDGWPEAKLIRVGVLGEDRAIYLAETRDKERLENLLRNAAGFARLRQRTVLWIADGAPYNWNVQKRLCSHAHCLVDYWHVMEHVYECARTLFGEGDECVGHFAGTAARLLLNGRPKQLIAELKQCSLLLGKNNKARHQGQSLKTLWRYLEKHIDRLNYKIFLENGWPIGSGAIESAHRWVLQKRMKQAGMKWSKENAQRMASARALYASVGPKNLFYDYLLKADARAA